MLPSQSIPPKPFHPAIIQPLPNKPPMISEGKLRVIFATPCATLSREGFEPILALPGLASC